MPVAAAATRSASVSGSAAAVAPKPKKCVVCMDRVRNVLLLPCKHMILCRECAADLESRQALQQCPYCRQLCLQVVKVHH
jgi:hypothetical protein